MALLKHFDNVEIVNFTDSVVLAYSDVSDRLLMTIRNYANELVDIALVGNLVIKDRGFNKVSIGSSATERKKSRTHLRLYDTDNREVFAASFDRCTIAYRLEVKRLGAARVEYIRGRNDLQRAISGVFSPHRKSSLSSVELSALNAVDSTLTPEGKSIFASQTSTVYNVTRAFEGLAVNCYPSSESGSGNMVQTKFPLQVTEVKLATVWFSSPMEPDLRNAAVYLVRGVFFSILFDYEIANMNDIGHIDINRVELHVDPMLGRLGLPEIAIGGSKFSGWLSEWVGKRKVRNVSRTVSNRVRISLLQVLPANLPPDYLECTMQCDGVTVNDIVLLGLSQAYEFTLDRRYLVLALKIGSGVLGLSLTEGDNIIYFLSYSGGLPIPLHETLAWSLTLLESMKV